MPAKKASFGAEFFPDDKAEYEVQHNPRLRFFTDAETLRRSASDGV